MSIDQTGVPARSQTRAPYVWTAEEDDLVRKHVPSEAVQMLPHRTLGALSTRRYKLGVAFTPRDAHLKIKNAVPVSIAAEPPPRSLTGNERYAWTNAEDEIVLAHVPSKALKLLPHRTRQSIAVRRYILRNPEPIPDPAIAAHGQNTWTALDVKILRKYYPTAKQTKDLMPRLPRFTVGQIRAKASQMKIKKRYNGDPKAEGLWELLDQVLIRAKEDGITRKALDLELKTGWFFRNAASCRKPGATCGWVSRMNLKHVNRAVEFFGGKLVIDWNDR